MILIGIDPDTKASGVALYNKEIKLLELYNFPFFKLYDFLKQKDIRNVKVILEAGWLNKGNWHTGGSSKTAATAIGNKTGANHEAGKKIEEMLQYLNIPYELRKPTTKKVDSKFFEKLTGIKRSNQDARDAALLVIGY